MLAPLLLTLIAAAPAFEVEPYLHVRPNEGLHVAWTRVSGQNLAPAVTEQLQLQLPDGNRKTVAASQQAGVTLAALPWACDVPPGATYFVTGMVEPQPIASWPCAGSRHTVKLGFVTDTQQDLEVALQSAELLAKQGLTGVIHGGDIVNWGGSDDQWVELLASMHPSTKNAPLVVAAGNHDFFWDSDGDHLGRYFGVKPPRSWYRTRVGPVQLIVLDSNHVVDERWLGQQEAFLEQALITDAPWTVVVFHHAIFSEGIAHSELLSLQTQRHDEAKAAFLDTFEAAGVDVVLTGHTHLFERSRKAKVEYVVGGPAGGVMGLKGGLNPYSLRSDPLRTVSVLEADPTRLVVRTLDFDGQEVDRFTLRRTTNEVAEMSGVGMSRRLPQHVAP